MQIKTTGRDKQAVTQRESERERDTLDTWAGYIGSQLLSASPVTVPATIGQTK